MESGRESETLEGGFLESKLNQNEILCSKFQEDGILGHLSNSNEISNVELARKFGVGGVEESMVDGICGNNRMNEVLVNGYSDEKLSISMHNLDMPVFEGDQIAEIDDNLCCDALVHDVKIEAHMKKNDDVLHPHEPGSPTKIEVSGSSINLFVEVFGPLDGISDDNLDHCTGCQLEENDVEQELSLEEIGSLSTGVTDLSAICDEQECTFDVGDLAWLKTRNQLWWPGMISDPSSATDDIVKCEKKGCYLVKLYGNAHFIWCDSAALKPFVQYFDQMSRQINSRNFCGSVERAICEIGLRVQLNMTCPCFLKVSQTLDAQWSLRDKGENCMSTEKASKFDVVSLSQFQPAAFIADIKDLARSIHVPNKVVLMVMKNRLSPFYRSMGHLELPLQLIRSGSDAAQNTHDHLKSGVGDVNSTEDHDCSLTRSGRKRKIKNNNDGSDHVLGDYVTSSAKGVESRERKKSRYLSYPYVDVIKGQEKEDQKQKGSKKSIEEQNIISKEDDISACSAELLAELCSSARDCSYISRSKYSDSLKRFYCSYRRFSLDIATKAAAEAQEQMEGSRVVKKSKKQKMNLAFAKESVENVVGDICSVAGVQKPKRKYTKRKKQLTNAEEQMEGIRVMKESENDGVSLASGSLENAHKLPETENPRAKENGVCLDTSKEKEKVIPQNYFPNIYPKSSWMISFQQACSNLFKTPHKSVGVAAGLVETNLTPRLPDLNGNHPGFHVDHILAEGHSTNLVNPVPEQKNLEGLVSPAINGVHQTGFTPVSSSNGVHQTGFTPVSSSKGVPRPMTFHSTPLSTNGVTGPYQCVNRDVAVRALDPITGIGSTIQPSFRMGDFLAACKPVAKKRKRKENTCEVASGIPDLNGNVLDTTPSPLGTPMSPLGTTLPEGSHIPPSEGETQRKKRNKYDSGESGGGSLVLNFAAGTVPAKETLVAAFSRFGLLKESELEVMSDDSVKIVYERSSDARFAFRSLEKSHTFGESLLNFNLDCCMPEPPKIKKKTNFQLQTFVPVTGAASKIQTKAVEARPDMAFIKKNVEMMKSTLEKAGDKLSPETRAKLENEIKLFLDKISSSTGPGSAL